MVTLQVSDEPEQAPPHPAKRADAPAAAVRVTTVPDPKDSEQSPGQATPAGVLATEPGPLTVTVSG